MSEIVNKIKYAMSLRTPQEEALSYLDAISSYCDYKKDSKDVIEAAASEYCEKQRKVKAGFEFPSFCYAMATGIGKTRLMGASIYYLYKTKGYKHFFILAPGNTIYEKLRKESNPNHPKYIFKGLEAEMGRPKVYDGENYDTYPIINQQLLSVVDAQILEVNDAMNTLACMLLDSISELSYDDADFVIDVVEQYLSQIPGDEENKRRIVRRYASLIVADIRKQIYEHMDRKTQDVHIIQKDLILFRKFVKNVKEDGKVKYDKPFSDKSNIKKYLFTGYKKSYYPANAFDSDTERLFSIILEEDPDVIRWIKPPLNQLGLFWKAGQQYNPDFLVETTAGKFMVEVKALNEVTSDEVVSKAREGIKWCRFASTADPDHKPWEYKLISDDNIHLGNTCKYTLGTAHAVKEEA